MDNPMYDLVSFNEPAGGQNNQLQAGQTFSRKPINLYTGSSGTNAPTARELDNTDWNCFLITFELAEPGSGQVTRNYAFRILWKVRITFIDLRWDAGDLTYSPAITQEVPTDSTTSRGGDDPSRKRPRLDDEAVSEPSFSVAITNEANSSEMS